MKKPCKIPLIIIITAFLTCNGSFYRVAFATQAEEQAVFQVLSSHGLKQVEVFIPGETVTVRYLQRYAEFKAVDEAAVRVAEIAHLVNRALPAKRQVCIHQLFDDGQIVEVTVATADAQSLLNKTINTEVFLDRVRIDPLTRGVLIVPGVCEPDKGKNCQNCEACACYPNEVCSPGDPNANKRGCVMRYIPENTHLVGTEYVCKPGYKWNSALTGCVDAIGSPANLPDGKPAVSTVAVSSVIRQILLLDGIPPSPWNQKQTFTLGDNVYVWVESKILNKPHTLEIVWVDPSGKEIKRERFELRGWGAGETFWSELQTGRQQMQGQWKVDILVDGQVEAPLSFILNP